MIIYVTNCSFKGIVEVKLAFPARPDFRCESRAAVAGWIPGFVINPELKATVLLFPTLPTFIYSLRDPLCRWCDGGREGGAAATISHQTPSSNGGEQPGRQEVRRCHEITRLFVYASIGSPVLAFCSGEQRSGARLLT